MSIDDKTTDTDQSREKDQEALSYHENGRPGKIEITSTKPTFSARDLSLAYSPGVAIPCQEIQKNPDDVFRYTIKGNLVGVVTNGSAVLGLGNIGPLAAKPVMEGKGVLFKRFADIDVFDIEVDEPTVEGMVRVVSAIAPTFGGINLEDLKAPECFEIEKQLKEKLDIPVFHDDQHGTAIIASAAFLNAVEVTGKVIGELKIVFSGAGAAAMACADLFFKLGVKKENLIMTDSKGVIYAGRTEGMNSYKERFAVETDTRTLGDAMVGADAFIGCSLAGLVSKEMVASMGSKPIIFAMANPRPEIMPEEVAEVRSDAIMATGRSDYPNQVNNVLGFPFIFRGALDVRARKINEEMKIAAVHALASLAKEEVPDDVKMAYGDQEFSFGPQYLIPKPFDKRVLIRLAPAVAKAAMKSGVARKDIKDFRLYTLELEARLGSSAAFVNNLRDQIPREHKARIVFPEGSNSRVLRAVSLLHEEGLVEPVLLGKRAEIEQRTKELGIRNLDAIEVISTEESDLYPQYVEDYHQLRGRKGATHSLSRDLLTRGNYFASMMLRHNHADGMITGTTQNYPECIKPIMRVLGEGSTEKVAGIVILLFRHKVLFLADCTAQIDPSAEDLSLIARSTVQLYQRLMKKRPRVAFLSFSNFGSNRSPQANKMKKAVELTQKSYPNMIVDGEVQADVAVNENLLKKFFSFSKLDRAADVLIFPDLSSANISYKLLAQMGGAITVGPILVPMKFAANIVQRTSTVEEIISMTYLTTLMAKELDKSKLSL